MFKNFNSEKTEKLLAYKYENNFAKIFQNIKSKAMQDEKHISLSNSKYKLLIRFFTIMWWRRNDIQIQSAKEMGQEFENMMDFYMVKAIKYNKP